MDKQFTSDIRDTELCPINPYSKAACMILYLYSMELGSPQLYADVNRVVRENDLSYLEELGPFVYVLTIIVTEGEKYKNPDDKVTPGEKLNYNEET